MAVGILELYFLQFEFVLYGRKCMMYECSSCAANNACNVRCK